MFPETHAWILVNFREHLRSLKRGPNSKVVAVLDSIVSSPGVYVPWREMVQICKEEGVYSVIDAAHSIGQEVDIELHKADPDFFVTVSNSSCLSVIVP